MRHLTIFLMLSCLGCNRADRLLGIEHSKPVPEPQFYVASCCRGTDDVYPSFVPASHVALCKAVLLAEHSGERYGGNIWLAMNTDCGRHPDRAGDQYYPSTGY